MSRFIIGDELGNIKALRYRDGDSGETKLDLKTLRSGGPSGTPKEIQQLTASTTFLGTSDTKITVVSAFSGGDCCLSSLDDEDILTPTVSWKESQDLGDRFVGLELVNHFSSNSNVITCTSNGTLRRTPVSLEEENKTTKISEAGYAALPSSLTDWRISSDTHNFIYGGDEVAVSLWDTNRAFMSTNSKDQVPGSKKRKRNDLFPAEIWRARNLPNDNLGLHQPMRITTLAFLNSSGPNHDITSGTQFGDILRYDTKSGRRPVSNWSKLCEGGVKAIARGFSDHELFVANGRSNVYALDLRNGNIIYGYKGISGSVRSLASSPQLLVSTALDRYARVHSVVAPPEKSGSQQEGKGEVLEKVYLTATATTVVWDQRPPVKVSKQEHQAEADEVWDQLESVS